MSNVTNGERSLEASIGFGSWGNGHTIEKHFKRISRKGEAESTL